MTLEKKIKIILAASFSILHAGELKIKNSTTIPVNVVIMAKENRIIKESKKTADSFSLAQTIQSGIIQPEEEISVTLDEKKFKEATFSVQGTTITAPPIIPITSKESIVSGYEGEVVFSSKDGDSELVCSITQVNMDYSSLSQEDKLLVDKALEATKNSYAPYSNFYVGSALETMQGNIFTGCNIENASYGAANCAERTAIFNAIAHEGAKMKIKTIVALCKNKEGKLIDGCSCGICRQVISEFSTVETRIIYQFNNETPRGKPRGIFCYKQACHFRGLLHPRAKTRGFATDL